MMKKILMISISSFLLLSGCSSSVSNDTAEETSNDTQETVALETQTEETELETIALTRSPDSPSAYAGVFISTNGDFSNYCEPSVMFYSDGTFIFNENCLSAMNLYSGTYEYKNDQYICNVQSVQYDCFAGSSVKQIVLANVDKGLELRTTLCGSQSGHLFVYVNQLRASGTYVSTADFEDPYKPTVEFSDDGTFTFTENLLSGMGEYSGIYLYDGNQYYCKVKSLDFSGIMGDNVKEIIFGKREKGIYLYTDLCGSEMGDLFVAGQSSSQQTVSSERKGTVFIAANADSNRIKVRKSPGLSGEDTGERKYSGERVTVYEETAKDGYTWYRIGTDRWMAGNGTSFGIQFD